MNETIHRKLFLEQIRIIHSKNWAKCFAVGGAGGLGGGGGWAEMSRIPGLAVLLHSTAYGDEKLHPKRGEVAEMVLTWYQKYDNSPFM